MRERGKEALFRSVKGWELNGDGGAEKRDTDSELPATVRPGITACTCGAALSALTVEVVESKDEAESGERGEGVCNNSGNNVRALYGFAMARRPGTLAAGCPAVPARGCTWWTGAGACRMGATGRPSWSKTHACLVCAPGRRRTVAACACRAGLNGRSKEEATVLQPVGASTAMALLRVACSESRTDAAAAAATNSTFSPSSLSSSFPPPNSSFSAFSPFPPPSCPRSSSASSSSSSPIGSTM